jgi:hypothetical protein
MRAGELDRAATCGCEVQLVADLSEMAWQS